MSNNIFKIAPVMIGLCCIMIVLMVSNLLSGFLSITIPDGITAIQYELSTFFYLILIVYLGTVLLRVKDVSCATSFYIYAAFVPVKSLIIKLLPFYITFYTATNAINVILLIYIVYQSYQVRDRYLANYYKLFSWTMLASMLLHLAISFLLPLIATDPPLQLYVAITLASDVVILFLLVKINNYPSGISLDTESDPIIKL